MKTFEPKLKTVDGRLAYIGRSGAAYFLDDFDTAAEAKQAAYDQPPHWHDEK